MSEQDERQGETLHEVRKLTEPERGPECCGKPMRKLQSVSPATGKRLIRFSCDKCGTQRQGEAA